MDFSELKSTIVIEFENCIETDPTGNSCENEKKAISELS